MIHFIVGLGIEISDTRHVQDTSNVLEHGNGNNVNFLVPITDDISYGAIPIFFV